MATIATPGVYIKEVSLFPPSVAEVETALPAFIGYTEKAKKKGEPLTNVPRRIKSLVEYETYFGGGAPPTSIAVVLDADNEPTKVTIVPEYLLYESLRLFFDNGGGDCYIVSVGSYSDSIAKAALDIGIDALEKYDEPTLLLFPDAVLLIDTELADLQKKTLTQCANLQDRFGVFDLRESGGWETGKDGAWAHRA